jgi:hypothetical protein
LKKEGRWGHLQPETNPSPVPASSFPGWYLMFPPVHPPSIFPSDPKFKQGSLNLEAPLYEWWIAQWRCGKVSGTSIPMCSEFRTSNECKAAITSMKLTDPLTGVEVKMRDDWKGRAQCINADDAQLKGWALKWFYEVE